MSDTYTPTVGFKISAIGRLLRKGFDRRVSPLGLTRAQWRTFHAVRSHPGAMQRQIAEILEIESVTAGRLIDRLVSCGWVERRADPKDRRMHRLFATEKAEPMFRHLRELGEEAEEIALQGLNPQERAQLSDFLDRISDNLARSLGREVSDNDDSEQDPPKTATAG